MQRIVILGGGFGGINTAVYLERYFREELESKKWELVLVNRDNYFVYQPMLSEIVGGTVDILDTVSPIRNLLYYTHLYVREIAKIDLAANEITLTPEFTHTFTKIPYDHLILALGNVTLFSDEPGLHAHALPFKNLNDAMAIRNRIIDAIEAAAVEKNLDMRKKLLTFVVGGGGFSGTEVCAEINDFARKLCRNSPEISEDEIRVILVHSKTRLMDRELSESLGHYAGKVLSKRGVEILFEKKLITATPEGAVLDDKTYIPSKTIVSTVPIHPNPLVAALEVPKIKDRIKTNAYMQVEGYENVWALGDCASVPVGNDFAPPTAQFAVRQGKQLALNLIAQIEGNKKKEFHFKTLGMLAALGHHSAVAELFGRFKFSGFSAWVLWRMIYWVKLPGLARKIKTAFTWFLNLLLPTEAIRLKFNITSGIMIYHYEADEIIFHEGDVGDYLYLIIEGEVKIYNQEKGFLANLQKGEYFGEIALLNQKNRIATAQCIKPTNLLVLSKKDFDLLVVHFSGLKKEIEETYQKRKIS